MDIGVISVRYARALLKSATDAKIEQQVYAEMQQIAKSYIEVPQLRSTIDNPMLSKEKKQALLLTAAGKEPSDLMKAFIMMWLFREITNSAMEWIRSLHQISNPYIRSLIRKGSCGSILMDRAGSSRQKRNHDRYELYGNQSEAAAFY